MPAGGDDGDALSMSQRPRADVASEETHRPGGDADRRIRRLFRVYHEKGGGVEHGAQMFDSIPYYHPWAVIGGAHDGKCAGLLSRFSLRDNKSSCRDGLLRRGARMGRLPQKGDPPPTVTADIQVFSSPTQPVICSLIRRNSTASPCCCSHL